jgi:endonuclease-3
VAEKEERMPRESRKARTERAARIFHTLEREYPEAETALNHENPFQLAVATILSAQCTDERVNLVTPELFRRFPDPEALAGAPLAEVEEIIHSTGFFRSKAKNIVGMARALVEDHGGDLPRSIQGLTALPGIGRKTANVVLGNAFGIDEGVVVDTHVKRLSGRMGFTRETAPEKVERDLMEIFPRKNWTLLSHLLILHGRAVCPARKPRCEGCSVAHLCPSSTV